MSVSAGTSDTTQTTPSALERGAADGGSDRSCWPALYVLSMGMLMIVLTTHPHRHERTMLTTTGAIGASRLAHDG